MNTTYTITEGNDALNRALLMMRYDLGKTSNENVISEQMPEPGDFKDNPSYGGKNVDISKIPSTGYYTIKATTLSEGILKMREFFYSPIGATTQVVLSIVGVEIGVPLVFQILDGAIITNDAYIMVRDWDSNGPKISYESGPMGDIHTKGLWEWFEFHFKSNIGFQYLCVDILAVLAGFGVMGLGKIATKSVKSIFKLLIEKLGKNFPGRIAEFLSKFKPETNKMPKEIGTWVDRKMSEVNKAIELLKTPKKAAKSVLHPVKLTIAGIAGVGTYKLMKWFETKNDVINKFFEDNPNSKNFTIPLNLNQDPKEKTMILEIINNNPKLFPKDFKLIKSKIVLSKKESDSIPYYIIIINDVKYKMDESLDNLTLTKIN